MAGKSNRGGQQLWLSVRCRKACFAKLCMLEKRHPHLDQREILCRFAGSTSLPTVCSIIYDCRAVATMVPLVEQPVNPYEQQRAQRIARNNRVLGKSPLGLL